MQGKCHPEAAPAVHGATRWSTATTSTCTGHPQLHAIQAEFIDVNVTDPQGRKVTFVPWFGALAHAIFFHQGSLDYFHTHICAPNAPNCGAPPGVSAPRDHRQVDRAGQADARCPAPAPGTWRLFLQMKLGGRVITAPYTLNVAS